MLNYRYLIIMSTLLLSACSVSVQEYKDSSPALHLNAFFNGRLEAHGMIQNFKGKAIRSFTAELAGRWDGDKGILDERFIYDDGEVQYRCWHLTKSGNQYTGTASDVIGEAVGETQGNALNWKYKLQVPVNGRVMNIGLNDWLYLIDENHLINRATMTYFGIPVGEITLSINKISNEPGEPLSAECTAE